LDVKYEVSPFPETGDRVGEMNETDDIPNY